MNKLKTFFSSRRNILLTMLGLLLVLDLARSVYVRVGYASAGPEWQPPHDYAVGIAYPPGSDLPADAPLGQKVYVTYCAYCHGPDGKGNGMAAPSMIPRPRDFTLGLYAYKSTGAGQPPTDDDLKRTVREGLRASAMPYWSDILSAEEIDAVVQYIKNFSPHTFATTAPPLPIPARVEANGESIARGQQLYQEQQCDGCHGDDGRAMVKMPDKKGNPVIARDLTAPWTFRGGSEPHEIWLRLTHGGAPGPMPAYAEKLSDTQRWDVVNYVLSLARIAPWDAGGKLAGPGHDANLSKRGEYIVHAQMCGLCHTEVGTDAIYRDDKYLAGGMRITAYPYGVFTSRNLTSDDATGVGSWTPEQLARAVRFGQTPTRSLDFFAMPWAVLHQLNDDDANAIGTYLTQTSTPVNRRMPAPGAYGFLETTFQKIRGGLPVAVPERLTYASGNFAEPFWGMPRDLPQTILVALQWLALLAGIGGIIYLTVRRRQFPKHPRGWILFALGMFALLLCALFSFVISALPGILPPDMIVQNAAGQITTPNTNDMTPEQKALAERGMYLYASSCILCHNANAAGGQKNNGAGAGTMWSRNISPDTETGIGSWTEQQIARAIRSGVSKDGRALYWQAMPWDHFSNLDEEDVRSLAAYLKAIPPVHQAVPLPLPPAPGDCPELNVFIQVNLKPGCQ
ncbi:MAG: hypothetical protein BroJett039_05410 [Chloroflexota bacterium]|nr:MAG: hypothetical protein BroJett039_05410 [Chloroflexota bacterium]